MTELERVVFTTWCQRHQCQCIKQSKMALYLYQSNSLFQSSGANPSLSYSKQKCWGRAQGGQLCDKIVTWDWDCVLCVMARKEGGEEFPQWSPARENDSLKNVSSWSSLTFIDPTPLSNPVAAHKWNRREYKSFIGWVFSLMGHLYMDLWQIYLLAKYSSSSVYMLISLVGLMYRLDTKCFFSISYLISAISPI